MLLKPNLLCFRKSNFRFFLRTMSLADSVKLKTLSEGKAEIFVPETKGVFYNPVQEFNRDLSVAVLRLLVKKSADGTLNKKKSLSADKTETNEIRVLEALSASGLRSIRYAKEVPGLSKIVANDLSASAVKIIQENIAHNKVEDKVTISHNDACAVMFENRHPALRFDAVDLDPYGCPSIFLDTAVQCVKDGGILLVTCTDMAILCGNTPNTCYVKYGAVSLKSKACHEMALRIVLQCIESHATRYKRYIVPLLSISVDFYVRVFVQVFTSAVICKQTTSKLSMVYQCTGCETQTLQPLGLMKNQEKNIKYYLPKAPTAGSNCSHCGSGHHIGGPIWSAPIHNEEFLSELLEIVHESDLNTKPRLQGVLSVIKEELQDVPLYYSIDRLCGIAHATSMSMITFRSALMNAGYRVSFSHASKTSIKSDAPMSVIWDVIRAWVKKNPVSEKKLISDAVARTILSSPCTTEVDFSLRRDANPLSRELKLVRYQENPLPNWGPGTRAAVNVSSNEKKVNNTNKRKRRIEEVGNEDVEAKKIDSE